MLNYQRVHVLSVTIATCHYYWRWSPARATSAWWRPLISDWAAAHGFVQPVEETLTPQKILEPITSLQGGAP